MLPRSAVLIGVCLNASKTVLSRQGRSSKRPVKRGPSGAAWSCGRGAVGKEPKRGRVVVWRGRVVQVSSVKLAGRVRCNRCLGGSSATVQQLLLRQRFINLVASVPEQAIDNRRFLVEAFNRSAQESLYVVIVKLVAACQRPPLDLACG